MPSTASYKHHFNQPAPARTGQKPPHGETSFVAYGPNEDPRHAHDWRRKPNEQQPLAAENRFIWYCTGCNELKTLDYWQKP